MERKPRGIGKYQVWITQKIGKMIKNMLKRRKESNTYLATIHRHSYSKQITMKIDKILELSACTVAFISCRGRLTKVFTMKASVG